MSRIEPTVGNLDDLFNDQDIQASLIQVQDLATAHVDLAAEALQQASIEHRAEAEANYIKALELSRKTLEALGQHVQGRRHLVEAQQDYLQGRPERGADVFDRAAHLFRQSAQRLTEVGYGMADWPETTWKALGQRVDNGIVRMVEAVQDGVQDRKARVQGWFQQVGQRIEIVAQRVQAIPAQIQALVRQTGQTVREAALDVVIPALRWGVTTEERLRAKARNAADVGEAVVKTAADFGQELGQASRRVLGNALKAFGDTKGQLTQAFDKHLADAKNRRPPSGP